jgi:hypothetical protein
VFSWSCFGGPGRRDYPAVGSIFDQDRYCMRFAYTIKMGRIVNDVQRILEVGVYLQNKVGGTLINGC